jgi:hypothetical protein
MTMRDGMKVNVLVVAACLAGCPQGSMPDDPVDPFFVDINAAWTVRGEPGHTFAFLSDPDGQVSSARIEGSEMLPGGGDPRQLDGTFDNRTICFTSTLGVSVSAFEGTFRDEVTMELTANGNRGLVILDKVFVE